MSLRRPRRLSRFDAYAVRRNRNPSGTFDVKNRAVSSGRCEARCSPGDQLWFGRQLHPKGRAGPGLRNPQPLYRSPLPRMQHPETLLALPRERAPRPWRQQPQPRQHRQNHWPALYAMIQFGCIVPQTTSRCNAGLSAIAVFNIAVCGLAVSTVIGSENWSWYSQAVSLLILLEAVPFCADPPAYFLTAWPPHSHTHARSGKFWNCRSSGGAPTPASIAATSDSAAPVSAMSDFAIAPTRSMTCLGLRPQSRANRCQWLPLRWSPCLRRQSSARGSW